jgi:hypothetical protein
VKMACISGCIPSWSRNWDFFIGGTCHGELDVMEYLMAGFMLAQPLTKRFDAAYQWVCIGHCDDSCRVVQTFGPGWKDPGFESWSYPVTIAAWLVYPRLESCMDWLWFMHQWCPTAVTRLMFDEHTQKKKNTGNYIFHVVHLCVAAEGSWWLLRRGCDEGPRWLWQPVSLLKPPCSIYLWSQPGWLLPESKTSPGTFHDLNQPLVDVGEECFTKMLKEIKCCQPVCISFLKPSCAAYLCEMTSSPCELLTQTLWGTVN